jgi:hypothetical protein
VNLRYASADLLQKDKLFGKAVVEIQDMLLSGRDAGWIDGSGRRSDKDIKVSKRTLLEAEFEASLLEKFDVKRSFLSRKWIFPGVSLQTSRMDDIKSVLLDMGFIEAAAIEEEKRRLFRIRHALGADQETSEFIVWIQLTENPLPVVTTRERKVEDSETYRTEIKTGELTIDFYAQMNGAGGVLAMDAETIMSRLKDQFSAVADMR